MEWYICILEIQNTDKCTMNIGTQMYALAVKLWLNSRSDSFESVIMVTYVQRTLKR